MFTELIKVPLDHLKKQLQCVAYLDDILIVGVDSTKDIVLDEQPSKHFAKNNHRPEIGSNTRAGVIIPYTDSKH